MKKLLLLLLCVPLNGFGQKTYVPDDSFESYLESNGMGDGIVLNDSVFTSAIDTATNLDYMFNLGIYDLTGIEDFISLIMLDVSMNHLTNLDVSNNINLTDIYCGNNQLTTLDVSNNIFLDDLYCNNNQITDLDVSSNVNLRQLYVHENQLMSLDLRNGNNINLYPFKCYGNPLLSCINVDDSTYSTDNWFLWFANDIDPQNYFSDNCPPSSIQEYSANIELFKVTDLLGREINQTNQLLFYIYDDGTVEKRIIVE